MKKHLAILVAIAIMITAAMPVMTACNTKKTVKSISVVNPTTVYTVGDTIDYDSLSIKVTFDDDSSETKTVKQLEATVVPADLSKSGSSFYKIVYKDKEARVDITVKEKEGGDIGGDDLITVDLFAYPEFYSKYLEKSADRGEGVIEERADFRRTGETYEVGNVNRFIFKPIAEAFDAEKGEPVAISNVKTVAKVFVSDSKDGTYAEVTGDNLAEFVTISDNTYKFSDKAAGKFVRLEISLDESAYDVEEMDASDRTLPVRLYVVDGGYNVYDQTGLSVMADLEKGAWSEIWKSDISKDVDNNKVTLIAREDSLKLPADDKPLCEYVDNITTVILHDSIALNPDNMPSKFFWTSTSNDLYDSAYQSLAAQGKTVQDGLIGTLRDGNNSGVSGGVAGDRNYMRLIDTTDAETEDGVKYDTDYGIELGFGLNMQKSIFSTKKVNVSGNYQSITTPERGVRSAQGRLLETYVDWDGATAPSDPVSHWFVFQMYQSKVSGTAKSEFVIKNIALKGNDPQKTVSEQGGFRSAGLMLNSSYAASIDVYNVNASSFFSNVLGDNYGDFKFSVDNGSEVFDNENGTVQQSFITVKDTKIYDAYSNMMYLWRSHAEVINSDMIGSGGPLFIMCDGDRRMGSDPLTASDEGACDLIVDNDSKLQAYADGNESWYKTWNATPLFSALKTRINPVLNMLGKTMQFESPNADNKGREYINVIALMICEPSELLSGGDDVSSKEQMRDPRGMYKQLGADGQPSNVFAMHNEFANIFRATAPHAAYFAPILQAGRNIFAITGTTQMGNMTIPTIQRDDGSTDLQAEIAAWQDNDSDKLCIYLSAALADQNAIYAPYFGVVVDLAPMNA